MKQMTLIVKKAVYKDWISQTYCVKVPRLFYRIVKLCYQIKGYKVEIYEE